MYGVGKICFPRCIQPSDCSDVNAPVLIGFSDASQMAYTATRGVSPEYLDTGWLHGSKFLSQPLEDWPLTPINRTSLKLGESEAVDSILEGRHRDPRMTLHRHPSVSVLEIANESPQNRDYVDYVATKRVAREKLEASSDWYRLKRVAARVLLFRMTSPWLKRERETLPPNFPDLPRPDRRRWLEAHDKFVPTVTEMRLAELVLLKIAQCQLVNQTIIGMAKLNLNSTATVYGGR